MDHYVYLIQCVILYILYCKWDVVQGTVSLMSTIQSQCMTDRGISAYKPQPKMLLLPRPFFTPAPLIPQNVMAQQQPKSDDL